MKSHLTHTFESIIIYLYVLLSSGLLFLSVFGQYNLECIPIKSSAGQFLLLFMTIALTLLFIFSLIKWISIASQKQLIIAAVGLFILMFYGIIMMLYCFRVIPITDGYVMLDLAKYMSENQGIIIDKSNLYQAYFGKYGNNYFLTVFFMHFFRVIRALGISNVYLSLFVFNAASIFLGNTLAFFLVKHVWKLRVAVAALVLLTINPASYFLVFWVYSCTLSIPLLVGIVYLGVLLFEESSVKKRFIYSILAGILSALSYYIRPTSVIPVIAFLIIYIIKIIFGKRVNRIHIFIFICYCCFLITSMQIIAGIIDNHFSNELSDNNFPITHWVMMGSHGGGEFSASDEAYTASFTSKDQKIKANLTKIEENYCDLGIGGTLLLFIRKTGNTFADGWSQCDVRLAQDTKFSGLYSYMADSRRGIFVLFCQGFRIIIYILMTLSGYKLLRGKQIDVLMLSSVLTFLGGAAFYALWEAKSVYSVPFIPIMIISSVYVLCGDNSGTVRIPSVRRYITLQNLIYIASCLLIMIPVLGYSLCSNTVTHRDYSLRFYSQQMCGNIEDLDEAGSSFSQSFYTDKAFNTVSLYATSTGEGEQAHYLAQLFNKNSELLWEEDISADSIRNNTIVLGDISIIPYESEEFLFKISVIREGPRKIVFKHRNSLSLDNYPGQLVLNGAERKYDLALSVYKTYKDSYFTTKACAALIVLLITSIVVSIVIIYVSELKISRKGDLMA